MAWVYEDDEDWFDPARSEREWKERVALSERLRREVCSIVGHREKFETRWQGPWSWCSTCGEHMSGPVYGPNDPLLAIAGITDDLLGEW